MQTKARGHVVNADPKKVRVQWTTGGCEYVKELGRQSEHIRLPNGESFKENSTSGLGLQNFSG